MHAKCVYDASVLEGDPQNKKHTILSAEMVESSLRDQMNEEGSDCAWKRAMLIKHD